MISRSFDFSGRNASAFGTSRAAIEEATQLLNFGNPGLRRIAKMIV